MVAKTVMQKKKLTLTFPYQNTKILYASILPVNAKNDIIPYLKFYGAWRSLVAHTAGGRRVGGSNPLAPIFFHNALENVEQIVTTPH